MATANSNRDIFDDNSETYRFTITLGLDQGQMLHSISAYTGISPSAVVTYLLDRSELMEIACGIREMQADGRYLPQPSRKRYTKTAKRDADRVLDLLPRRSK